MKINKSQIKVVIRNEQGQQKELTLADAANIKIPAIFQLKLVDAATGRALAGLGLRKAGQDLVLVDEDGKTVERVENFYDATASANQGEPSNLADNASGYVYAAQAQNQNQDSGAAAVPPQSQSSGLPNWLWPLGGGLALAGLANSGGGGSVVAPPTTPAPPSAPANTTPVVTNNSAAAAGTAVEAGHLDNGTVAQATIATGTLTASDPDVGATKTWSIQGTNSTTYGTFAVNSATGVWTYTLDNSAEDTQALVEGQSVTQSYVVRVTDNLGAFADQTVVVTIRGTNDKPEIFAVNYDDEIDNVTEDVSGEDVVTGTIEAGDVDTGAVLTYSAATQQGDYGSFHIDTHTGAWTYTLDNDRAATQALGFEDSYDESFIVSVRDDKGAIVNEEVTITVNGTNDAPTISAGPVQGWVGGEDGFYGEDNISTAVPSLLEDKGLLGFGEDWDGQSFAVTDYAVVQLAISDVDEADTLTLQFGANHDVAPDGFYGFGSEGPAAKGTYGYAIINQETNQIQYVISSFLTQPLAQGQVVYDSFTVVVDDGNGGTSSVDVVFSVTGTNDSPTVVFVPSDNGFVPYERYDNNNNNNNGQYDYDYGNTRRGYEIGNTRTVNEDGDVAFSGRQFNSRANNSIKLEQNDVDNFTILNLVDALSGETNLDNNAVVQDYFNGGEDSPMGGVADETFFVEAQADIKTIDILVTDEQGDVVAVPAQDLYWGMGEDDGLQVVLGTNRGDDFAFVGNTKDAVMFGFDGDDVYNFQIDGKANHITIADWVNTPVDGDEVSDFQADGEYGENDSIENGSQLNWNDTLKVMFDNDWAQSLQDAPRASNAYVVITEEQVQAAVNDTITGIGRGGNENVITNVVKALGSLKFTLNTTADGGYEATKTLHISTDNALTITGGNSANSRAAVTGSDEIDFTFNSIVNVEVEIIRLLNALQAVYGQTVSVTEITDGDGPTGLFEFTITNANLTATSAVIYDDQENDYTAASMGDVRYPVDGYITFSEWYDYGDYVTVTVGNKTYDYRVDTLGGVSGDVLANHFLSEIHEEGVTAASPGTFEQGRPGTSTGSNAAFGDPDIANVIVDANGSNGWQQNDYSNRATYDYEKKTITIYNADLSGGEFTVSSTITEHSHMTFDGRWAEGNLHVIGAEHGSHLIFGGSNNDFLIGGNGFDHVLGDVGRDTIDGGAGDDLIMGLAGDDVLTSGTGYDTITGGSGDDTIYLTSDEGEPTSARVVFDTFGVNGHDVVNNFSAGPLDSFSRSLVPGGDVLDFSAFLGAGSLANNTAQVEIGGYNYSRLTAFTEVVADGVQVDDGESKLIIVKVNDLEDFNSVGDIAKELHDGGRLAEFNIEAGGKAVFVFARDGGTTAEAFFINNTDYVISGNSNANDIDYLRDINRFEINHVASLTTSTDMIDNLLTANFMIA